MAGSCGTCTMCCKLMAVLELNKPRNVHCKYCDIGVGCKVYQDRPTSCEKFKCIWLQSQGQSNEMPLSMRPDHSKVVLHLSPDQKGMVAKVDPGSPMIWSEGEMARFLGMASEKIPVLVETGTRYYSINNRGVREVKFSHPDKDGFEHFEGYVQ